MPIDALLVVQTLSGSSAIEALGRRIVANGPGYRVVAETAQALTPDGLAEWRIYATNLGSETTTVKLDWLWRPSVASMSGPLRIVTTVGPNAIASRQIGRIDGTRSGLRIDGSPSAFIFDSIEFSLVPGATGEGELICVLAPCAPADFDGNGAVDGADFAMLLAEWGLSGGMFDLDGSGVVDARDVAIFVAAWTPMDQ
jgi:hypothetical protein